MPKTWNCAATLLVALLGMATEGIATAGGPSPYHIYVSNERSGDVTVIDGDTQSVVATVRVGKRPRGIHAGADGQLLYVALSGSPITGPPPLDARGNPIAKKGDDDEDEADHSADGIGVVDLHRLTFVKKLPAGSDPEEFAVSRDGRQLYVSNEDVATLSVVDVGDGRVAAIVRVKPEPEGVALSPDGSRVYVTCETGGEVIVIDASRNRRVAEIPVGGRPRTVAFLPDGSRCFIPSETTGIVQVFETRGFTRLKTIALPPGSRPMGAVMDARRNRLYISTGRAGTVCLVDPTAGTLIKAIAVGKRPWGLGMSPDGRRLYVANGPSDDVSVIDLDAEKEVGRLKAGAGPWGIAIVEGPP
jgi:YVTN family beta-propeller protein